VTVEAKVGFCTLCRSRCGSVTHVENGRLISVSPLPSHPTGRAICAKGRAAPEIAHSTRRLQTPLRRTNPKTDPDPGWVPISWDEALDEIAQRFDDIRKTSGPEAVAFAVSSPSGTPMCDSFDWADRFARVFGSPNHCNAIEICNWQKDFAHVFTFGCGTPPADYRNSDLIILWGFAPATSWLAKAGEIEEGRKRGAKVMMIDPRPSAQALGADYWLRVRPGTDGVLALGLAHLMIRSTGFDESFVREWTNAPLLVREDTGHFLRLDELEGGEQADRYCVWDIERGSIVAYDRARPGSRSAAITGEYEVSIAGTRIKCRPAYQRYLDVVADYTPERVSDWCGIPVEDLERAASAISAAKSIGYHAWTGISQHAHATQTERAIALLYALTGSFDTPGGNIPLNRQPINRINPLNLLAPEQAAKALGIDKHPIGPPSQGWVTANNLYRGILDRKPYAVRALLAFGSNILVSHANVARGREALQALEFHVHCELYETPTTQFADIVLPINSAWEREGLRIGFEISPEAENLIQLRQRMVEPQGESRSDLQVLFDLAVRLGMGKEFFDGDIDAALNHTLAPLGISVEQLRAKPEGIRHPVAQSVRKYRDELDGSVRGFATQTGRVEIYSEHLLRHGYDPLPMFSRVSDAAYPYVLTTARNSYYCHSQQRALTTLRKRAQEPVLELSSELAAEKGIVRDDWVLVSTPMGRARFRARILDRLQRDVIIAEYGWWEGCEDLALPGYAATGPITSNFNAIVEADRVDPVSGSVPMRSTICQIEREAASQPRLSPKRPFRVEALTSEADDVASLRLSALDDGAMPAFQPGQHVNLHFDAPGGPVSRAYSISSSRRDARSIRVSVKRLQTDAGNGIVSNFIHDDLRAGDLVTLEAPAGSFRIPLIADFPIVLIAAGIGITPFMSFLESAEPDSMPHTTLLYGNRDDRHHAFRRDIELLKKRLGRLSVVDFYSRPSAHDKADGSFDRQGRIDASAVDAKLIAARARFYLCGPAAMISELRAGLIARGVPKFEIFSESFHLPTKASKHHDGPFEINLLRSKKRLVWNGEAGNLLRFSESCGVEMSSGCRAGQCENCLVKVLSGDVEHIIDVELEEPGTCLTCCAVPLSDLVLDA
jgi:anaerobic selenocysteine-containing dehydrogenase/ferredoxin-NADP reductase